MMYHILNGDALTSRFTKAQIKGVVVVMREAFIAGDLSGGTVDDLWRGRANYLKTSYRHYREKVVSEWEKLLCAPEDSAFNLWFGHDLFCQVNLWFILSLIQQLSIRKRVFAVYPGFMDQADIWEEFGYATAEDLRKSFDNRIEFGNADLQLGAELWMAYKDNDLYRLEALAQRPSPCFPHLELACRAHIERFPGHGRTGLPERFITEIIGEGISGFGPVFSAFGKRAGMYGFGDEQFKPLYERAMKAR